MMFVIHTQDIDFPSKQCQPNSQIGKSKTNHSNAIFSSNMGSTHERKNQFRGVKTRNRSDYLQITFLFFSILEFGFNF